MADEEVTFFRRQPVYEVVAGRPSWTRLSRLAIERVAGMATRAVNHAVRSEGRVACGETLVKLRQFLGSELPASILREVLDVCIARDRLRCHHNPTDCLALELWRVFYNEKHHDISIVHHEFAFPKTSNYPEIVQNLDCLLSLMSSEPAQQPKPNDTSSAAAANNTTSFKLELKQCEIGFLLEERVLGYIVRLPELRVLEIPGLASDKLLHVIALYCTNLEVLNLKGSREQVSDAGFARFVEGAKCRNKIRQLDISRCGLSQQKPLLVLISPL